MFKTKTAICKRSKRQYIHLTTVYSMTDLGGNLSYKTHKTRSNVLNVLFHFVFFFFSEFKT